MKRFILLTFAVVLISGSFLYYFDKLSNNELNVNKRELKVFKTGKRFPEFDNAGVRKPSSYTPKEDEKKLNNKALITNHNFEEEVEKYNLFLQKKESFSSELIKKYSSSLEVKKLGPYSLIRLDKLSVAKGASKNLPSIATFYNYSIVEDDSKSSPFVYLDAAKGRFVLLTGLAIIKSDEKKINLPVGAKLIANVQETGIFHIQLSKDTDPFDGLEKIKSLNRKLDWANLEFVDRLEVPQ